MRHGRRTPPPAPSLAEEVPAALDEQAAGLERLLDHFGGELRALIAAVRANGQQRYEEELARLRAEVAELRSKLAVAGEVPQGDVDTKKSAVVNIPAGEEAPRPEPRRLALSVSIGTEPGPPIGVQSGPSCRHEGGTAGVVVAEP